MRVVVNGYEDGFDDVSYERIAVVKLHLNRGMKDWQGRHLEPATQTEEMLGDEDVVDALAILRESN
ncbi:MAG: hypothetical protein OXI69_09795 [Acidobacteriota bacterium]|nr:hypothetical protein [Acidobacteriota bacterium]